MGSIARAGQDGVKATVEYYSGSGKDERRLVKASFFTGIAGGVLWYPIILYWDALDFSSEEIGIMGALGTSAGILSMLIGGYLADKIGRRKLYLAALVTSALGFLLFVTKGDIVVFTIAYALTSIGGSLGWPSLMALMATKTSPQKTKFFYGIQGFANQVGVTIAMFLGVFGPPFVERDYGLNILDAYNYLFIGTAVCALAPILLVLKVSETKRERTKLVLHFDKRMRSRLFVYSFQNGMIGFGAAFLIPWFALIFEDGMGASFEWVAAIFTLSNAVIAAGWMIVPKFAEYRGSVALISGCQIASVVFMVSIPYSPWLTGVAVLYTLRSFLMLVPQPVLNAYVMNIVSEEIRASFLAISQIAWQLAYAASYAIAGRYWNDEYGKVQPFFISGSLYVAATIIFYLYFRKISEHGDSDIREVKGATQVPGG